MDRHLCRVGLTAALSPRIHHEHRRLKESVHPLARLLDGTDAVTNLAEGRKRLLGLPLDHQVGIGTSTRVTINLRPQMPTQHQQLEYTQTAWLSLAAHLPGLKETTAITVKEPIHPIGHHPSPELAPALI